MSCHTKPTQRKYRGHQGSGPRRREGTQDTKRSNNILRPARNLRVGHHQAPHRRSSQIKLSASPERGRGVRVLALVMCASVVRRSGRRLGGRSTASSSMCSNRAATRVNLLKHQEKQYTRNTLVCSYFAIAGKAQQTIAPPLHGGGQGFESLRLHSWNMPFCRQNSENREDLEFAFGPLYTIGAHPIKKARAAESRACPRGSVTRGRRGGDGCIELEAARGGTRNGPDVHPPSPAWQGGRRYRPGSYRVRPLRRLLD